MGLVSAIGLITGILPLVGHIVQGVEAVFGHGTGAQKKQAAIAASSDAINIYNQLAGKAIDSSQIQTALGQVIDAVVAFYNALGVFSHAK